MPSHWHEVGNNAFCCRNVRRKTNTTAKKNPNPGSPTIALSWQDQPDGSSCLATVVIQRPDGWMVTMTWVAQERVVVLRELHIQPSDPTALPQHGLTAEVLKKVVKTDDLKRHARETAQALVASEQEAGTRK